MYRLGFLYPYFQIISYFLEDYLEDQCNQTPANFKGAQNLNLSSFSSTLYFIQLRNITQDPYSKQICNQRTSLQPDEKEPSPSHVW